VTSTNLARIFGFAQKGSLTAGKDADIVVVDAHKNWQVRKEDLFTKNQWSAFEGMTLQGKPVATFLRGQRVYVDGAIIGEAQGQWLTS
jgi:dihydroorotase